MFTVVHIQSRSDWYNVTIKNFFAAGGGGLYSHYKSMTKLLSSIYPEYPACFSHLGKRKENEKNATHFFRFLYVFRGEKNSLLTFFMEPWEFYRFSAPHQLSKHQKFFSKQQHNLYEKVKQVRILI